MPEGKPMSSTASQLISAMDRKPASERKKKKSIRGVLDKVDLAEVYNCDSKRNKHKGDNLAISDFVPPVKAVEFKEAVLEQLLPDITESIEPNKAEPQRKTSGEHNFYETVRRISRAQLGNNNNNEIKPARHTSMQSRIGRESNSNNANEPNPVGYEPENSLRRVSAVVRPSSLQRGGAMRRRSALDKPSQLPIKEPLSIVPDPTLNSQAAESSVDSGTQYEPENSLRRARKISDLSGQGRPGRQRRTGLALVAPTPTSPPALKSDTVSTDDEKEEGLNIRRERRSRGQVSNASDSSLHTGVSTDSGCPSSDSSPTTPRSPRAKQPLFTLSIPEDETVSSEGSTSAPSPKPLRKISKARVLPSKLGLPHSGASGTSPRLYHRSISHDNMLPNRSRKSSLPSFSPASTPDFASPSSDIATPNSAMINKKAKDFIKAQASHINQTRYWDWYLLNASYSWKNFNSHTKYCY